MLSVGASSMDRSSNIACVIRITISSGDRDSSLIFPDKAPQLGTCLGLDRNWRRDVGVALRTSTSASGLRQVRWELLALNDGPKRGDPRHDAVQ